ncbi:MAG TPA: Crp/Fnr family transcriptional regulator [Bacteroidales bacterium]|nr:Crp/Fnr family transcriptional regulator [Bacteroidales bacterium]
MENKHKTWYDYLTNEQHKLLINNSQFVNFNKGETIIKQGIAANNILYLEQGLVKLMVEKEKRSTAFKILSDNTFIGLMCAFVKRSFDFSAVAITPSQVRLINRSDFEEAIRSNGDFAVYITQQMSLMTNKVVHDLIQLSHKNADGAICTVLTELASIFKSHKFQMPFSRVELANIVGYSKESVISCLSSLQRDGVIIASGKFIEILDMKRLEIISRHG